MRFSIQLLILLIAVIAFFIATILRGQALFGRAGAILFGATAVALFAAFCIAMIRWPSSSMRRRFLLVGLTGFPVAPLVCPRLMVSDYEHATRIGKTYRAVSELRALLAEDQRFRRVELTYYESAFSPEKSWATETMRVSGFVASPQDLEVLEFAIAKHRHGMLFEIADEEYCWVEWHVFIAP